jgi:hypothetical protein
VLLLGAVPMVFLGAPIAASLPHLGRALAVIVRSLGHLLVPTSR